MYWHARLDRTPDHVFRSAGARKRHDQIGLAFIEHPLITQWTSFLADFVPVCTENLDPDVMVMKSTQNRV